jgi:hypothetical protein
MGFSWHFLWYRLSKTNEGPFSWQTRPFDQNILPRQEKPAGLTTLDPPTPVVAGQSPFSTTSNFADLPSKEVTRNLCYYSLSCATCLVRIIHVPSFYEKLDKIYDRPVDSLNTEETHFLGLVYSVLALGCMYNTLDDSSSSRGAYHEAMEEGYVSFGTFQVYPVKKCC